MSTKQKSKSLFIVCAILFLAGLAGVSAGKGRPSVLSRVQTIDDPELSELVRAALENLPETKRLVEFRPYSKEYNEAKEAEEKARHRTVRLVTEAYVQIKLLDSQIEQSDAKIGSSNLPEALARELILARAELESQRATKLAELREIMHIIPRHALGRKPVQDLKDWLRLDVVGDSVLVFTRPKPFTDDERRMYDVFVKLMSGKEAMKYALDCVGDPNHWPVRVDILRNRDGLKLSEELEKELIRDVKRSKLELDAEVHLSEDLQASHQEDIFVLHGKMGFRYEIKQQFDIVDRVRRRTGTELHVRDPMDAEEFEKVIRSQLVGGPGRLPMKFIIKYDQQSKNLASRAEGTIKDIANKHGVEKLVEVTQEQMESEEKQ